MPVAFSNVSHFSYLAYFDSDINILFEYTCNNLQTYLTNELLMVGHGIHLGNAGSPIYLGRDRWQVWPRCSLAGNPAHTVIETPRCTNSSDNW